MQVYETMQTDLSQHWTLNMFNVGLASRQSKRERISPSLTTST